MSVSFNRSTKRQAAMAIAAAAAFSSVAAHAAPAAAGTPGPLPPQVPRVQLADGVVEGMKMRGQHKDVRVFRGIPYAAPPVGDFRFREPQPVPRWAGVLKARQFGPRCMQGPARGKSDFRSKEMNEDCLYLNVWTAAHGADEKRPVLVYFHGGGFASGDGSEPRYDGTQLAARGIVAVTVNYRLGVFGFLAPREAASESSNGTAGNYGLLDQVAALRWVRDNIAQFGGDPSQVTIAGNSAGAASVSAHMASPLSRGLFARAIGESGSAFGTSAPWQREQAENMAEQLGRRVGATSLQQLRSVPAQALLVASGAANDTRRPTLPKPLAFRPHIDGHFLNDSPEQVFANGAQAKVPLLVGSNSQEQSFEAVLKETAPTPENWRGLMSTMFPSHTEEVLAHYPGNDNDEVMNAGTALASDFFVTHGVWRWMTLHRETGQQPVFYYRYTQPHPPELREFASGGKPPQRTLGTTHDAQVAYALDNLGRQQRYAWTAADYDTSRVFSHYVEQFVKTGNPNGEAAAAETTASGDAAVQSPGSVPQWAAVSADNRGIMQQVIGADTHSTWDRSSPRQGLVKRLIENGPPSGLSFPNVR